MSNSTAWRPYVPLLHGYEQQFDIAGSVRLVASRWPWTVPVALLYFLAILLGTRWMRHRPAFHLRRPLAVWSAALSLFSALGALNVLPETLQAFRRGGLLGVLCDSSNLLSNRPLQFWNYVFCWSKLVEFGDTAFIVLRKQQLTYLHSVHHALTFGFTFFAYKDHSSILRLPAAMNFSIHFVMYAYYALRAGGLRTPRSVSIAITSLQILQMVAGALGIGVSLYKRLLPWTPAGQPQCSVTETSGVLGVLIYLLYLALFGNFFFQAYVRGGKRRQELQQRADKRQ